MGSFRRFGVNAGNVADTNIIAAVVPAAGTRLIITDLVVAARLVSANSNVRIQVADNGVAFVDVLEVELPTNGTLQTALGSGINVVGDGTRAVRVNFLQGTAGPISTTITGKTVGPRQGSGADL